MSTHREKYKILLIGTILILSIYGLFLRTNNLLTEPYWMDEGYTINAVLSYAEGHISGISAVLDSGRNYECLLYCFPTAQLANLFGFNQFSFRIISVLFGLISILALYYVSRKLFDKKIALLTAFFMNFAYFQIAWSMQARWYTMFTAFFWLAILFFLKSLESFDANNKNRVWFVFLTIIFTVLAIMSQKIGIVLPIFFVGYLIFISIKNKKIHPKISILISALIILLTYSMDVWSGQNLLSNFINKINFNYNLPYYLSFFLREYLVFIPFVIYAVIENKKYTWFLAGIFLAYLIPLSFLTNIVHYRYMFHVTPIFFILGSMGLFEALKNIPWQNKSKNIFGLSLFIVLFFLSGAGVFTPQKMYFLEADDPTQLGERPSYAYTPQPDWNAAYDFIKINKNDKDLVISSHPHFNKIFLGQAGYWIKYDYLGIDNRAQYSKDDKEFYVGAKIIDDLNELKQITSNSHGFIVFDYMAADGKIPTDIIQYIDQNLELVFNKKENSYSEIWVYRY